jgi:hypothetical protein
LEFSCWNLFWTIKRPINFFYIFKQFILIYF